jgi:hypothetical protein
MAQQAQKFLVIDNPEGISNKSSLSEYNDLDSAVNAALKLAQARWTEGGQTGDPPTPIDIGEDLVKRNDIFLRSREPGKLAAGIYRYHTCVDKGTIVNFRIHGKNGPIGETKAAPRGIVKTF